MKSILHHIAERITVRVQREMGSASYKEMTFAIGEYFRGIESRVEYVVVGINKDVSTMTYKNLSSNTLHSIVKYGGFVPIEKISKS